MSDQPPIPGRGVYDQPAAQPNLPPGYGCTRCGNLVHCTCQLARLHLPGCNFLRAAQLAVDIGECDHGFHACHICDPCDCGTGQTEGVR